MKVKSKSIVWHYPHVCFWMGGTSFIFEVLSQIKHLGYKTIFITNNGSLPILERFKIVSNKVITISLMSTKNIVYWLFLPLFLIFDSIATFFALRSHSDATFIATLFPSNVILAIVSKIMGRQFYYYCYEPYPFLQNPTFIKTFKHPKKALLLLLSFLYAPLDTWATRQAKSVFTLNEVTQKMIKKTYGVDSIITLMGVDSKHFSHSNSSYFNDLYPEVAIIAHSTDYTPMKNTDLAIQIFAQVHNEYPASILIITSTRPDAPEKKALQDLAEALGIEKKVIFLGLLDYSLLPVLYSNAICYLSTSNDEMLGTTSSNLPVKQALSCETPAIRSNITTEDVDDGISGYLIDPLNTTEATEKILTLLRSPKEARQMGKRGREKIQKVFTWRQTTENLLKGMHD